MIRFAVIVLVSLLLIDSTCANEPEPGKQVEQSLEIDGKKMGYLLFLPKDYQDADDDKQRWPLLVFLHGAGERGEDLGLVKKHGPPKIVETKPDFGFIVVSPQCPKGTYWDTDDVMKVIEHIQATHRVDGNRVYLTGLSMGGYGSWALAAQHPDRFAAVAPICGVGKPTTADRLLDMPIWAFHGDADQVVPLKGTTDIVNAIKEKGGKQIRVTVYEGVGHDSWTQTYNNPELYGWLLSHARKPTRDSKQSSEKSAVAKATLNDISWIAGSWAGEAMGGQFEESWNAPSFGSMLGMFKFIKDDRIVFYEILTIVEDGDSLLLRLKHFTPELVGWESKEDSVEFPLVSASENEAKFDGLIFTRVDDDKLKITVAVKEDGGAQNIEFMCQRVKK